MAEKNLALESSKWWLKTTRWCRTHRKPFQLPEHCFIKSPVHQIYFINQKVGDKGRGVPECEGLCTRWVPDEWVVVQPIKGWCVGEHCFPLVENSSPSPTVHSVVQKDLGKWFLGDITKRCSSLSIWRLRVLWLFSQCNDGQVLLPRFCLQENNLGHRSSVEAIIIHSSAHR